LQHRAARLTSGHQTVPVAAQHNRAMEKAADSTTVARKVEDIVGCKWSLAVLGAVRGGIVRPGAIEHSIDGLSKKVLNQRLAKLVRYGILSKTSWAEKPPRVEYALTPFGIRFCRLLDDIETLQRETAPP
jgi:DNA-binding HxlR family transcriptional regulator